MAMGVHVTVLIVFTVVGWAYTMKDIKVLLLLFWYIKLSFGLKNMRVYTIMVMTQRPLLI
jgi:hypothetical protein